MSSTPIVELSNDELVDDADRTNEMLRAIAHGPQRLVPQPRPKLHSLALPRVIITEVPEHEDAESAAKTLEMQRGARAAVQAAAVIPPEPPTLPRLPDVDVDLDDLNPTTPQLAATAPTAQLAAADATAHADEHAYPADAPSAYPSVMPAELDLPDDYYAARPASSGWWLVAGASVVCACIGALAGAVSLLRDDAPSASMSAATAPQSITKPSVVTKTTTTTTTATSNEPTIDVNALPVSGANKPFTRPAITKPSVKPAAAPPKDDATESTPPVVAAPPIEKGTIRTFASANGQPIKVDGAVIGTAGTPLPIACGRHSIAVGDERARTYDVPCNESITVGTP